MKREERGGAGKEEALLSRLEAYAQRDVYPLHMPGHKRRLEQSSRAGARQTLAGAAALDITEIDGFDNLHAPEGILRDAMARAARLYGAEHTFYSVNGSTAGLLTAISAAVPEGGTLIMARNCHKAVYHGVYLRRLRPVYLYPECVGGLHIADAITPEQVEDALREHPEAAAVLLTSPTYDGVTADVEQIARIVHQHGIVLIVDAAHGAHFGFHPAFPDSPVHLGADLTVVSLHKTMPCMTQTALLHVRGSRVDLDRIRLFEGIYQTSSPSYFLMAGMDECLRMTEEKGAALWDNFFREREHFLTEARKLSCLRIITAEMPPFSGECQEKENTGRRQMDPGKILIDTSKTGLSGKELYDILLEAYHLQPEMAAGNYVTAIMTCCDTWEGWQRLAMALHEIDDGCIPANALHEIDDGCIPATAPHEINSTAAQTEPPPGHALYPHLEEACSISDALDAPMITVPMAEAEGMVSGAFLNLYPPGIPLAVPGERLSRELIALLQQDLYQKLPVCGMKEGAVKILKSERRKRDEEDKNCLHNRTDLTE